MARNGVRVGIDLQQASIAGAQVKGARQSNAVTTVAVRALPEGLVFEGEVVDAAALAAELKSFWKDSGFTGKHFSLGVANQKIVVRTMEFPMIDEKELRAAIEFQAQEAIPIPLDDAVVDFEVLSTQASDDGGPGKQKVLIVAAQRDMILQFTDVAQKAGLSIDGIDLQAFALMRSVAPRVALVDQGATGGDATALVNIGAGTTNLVVALNGAPQFTRVVNVGCDGMVQDLMQHRGIDYAEADGLRLTVGVTGSEAPLADLEEATVGEIHDVLDAGCESFADEIRRSVDYYHSQEQDGHIAGVLLSGEGALTRNMCEYLGAALHLPVSLGDPLQYVPDNKTKLSQPELQAMSPRLAIALGLALDDEE